MTKKFEVLVTSVPDRDHVVAELWLDGTQFAEMSFENGFLSLEVFAAADGASWRCDPDVLSEGLQRARSALLPGQD